MISPDFLRGFLDTDGSVQIMLDDRTRRSGKNLKMLLGCFLLFKITQSKTNKNILQVIQKEYGGTLTSKTKSSGTQEMVYTNYFTTLGGQRIKQILLTNPPLNPSRYQDFLLASQIESMLDKKIHFTKSGQISIVVLAYKTTNQLNENSTIQKRKSIQEWVNRIAPTAQEKIQGENQANFFFDSFVKPNIKKLLKDLPKKQLSKDYMIGAHCGDGSFNFHIGWNPAKKYLNRPSWSITDSSKPYLMAFKNTMGKGYIKNVGKIKGNCFQFVLENVTPCIEKVFPIFEKAWLPHSKKKQFKRFKLACCMLKSNYLYTKKGLQTYLNVVYDMSVNHKRPYSKEIYMQWAEEQLKKKPRLLKRKNALFKKLMNF